jgi:hypothetical protein
MNKINMEEKEIQLHNTISYGDLRELCNDIMSANPNLSCEDIRIGSWTTASVAPTPYVTIRYRV